MFGSPTYKDHELASPSSVIAPKFIEQNLNFLAICQWNIVLQIKLINYAIYNHNAVWRQNIKQTPPYKHRTHNL